MHPSIRTGWIKVEVAGVSGRTFAECRPIVGDLPWTPVAWKDARDTGIEPGKPILLRFELYQAQVFGLEFE